MDIQSHRPEGVLGQGDRYLPLLLTSLQKEFIETLPGDVAEETVLLVFADHGHINVEPQETIYLNKYPKLVENLRTNNRALRS